MNKFAASFVFAAVAATAAFSAQASDSDTIRQHAQSIQQPAWKRAANAPQNFASQINEQPGHTAFVVSTVTLATVSDKDVPTWQRAANATQNYTSQINEQPGRIATN